MSVTFNELDSYKLSAEFGEGYCTHKIACEFGTPSSSVGKLMVGTWYRGNLIGKGQFETVWEEQCAQKGTVRAVKQIPKAHVKNTREILAFIKINPVNIVIYL